MLGADGVLLGTRFVATVESSAPDVWKQELLSTNPWQGPERGPPPRRRVGAEDQAVEIRGSAGWPRRGGHPPREASPPPRGPNGGRPPRAESHSRVRPYPMLVRADSAGATHDFVDAVVARNAEFSIGYAIGGRVRDALLLCQEEDWVPAVNTDGTRRPKAYVIELSDLVDFDTWPAGTRLICRRERPHPGAQLSLFDTAEGWRHTCFITNTGGDDLAGLNDGTGATPGSRTVSAAGRLRAGQPALRGLRPQPGLGRGLAAGRLPAGLDPAVVPRRGPGPSRTQDPALPAVPRRRPPRHPRPAAHHAHRCDLAVARRPRQRLHPATGRPALTWAGPRQLPNPSTAPQPTTPRPSGVSRPNIGPTPARHATHCASPASPALHASAIAGRTM
jgi:hypothetical protein